MPIRDPRDRFFYPTLTLIMDTYNFAFQIQNKRKLTFNITSFPLSKKNTF